MLRTPGAAAFSLSGWFGRFPKSNLSLGLILLVSSTTGSFAEAGLASAGLVAGMAFSGPFWSARMDRGGQRRVIAVALACLVASTALTSTLVVLRAPLPLWLAGAVLTGLSCPDIAAAVRARWTAATGGSLRIAAFAVETINDQMVFVVGPPIITVLSGTVHPLLGVAAALAPGVAGMLALVAQPGTEPPLHPLSERGKGWSARLPPLSILPVTLGCVGIGSFFGSYDVSVVAWGEDHGAPWASGVLLAVMAVAMGAGALAAGARRWSAGPSARFTVFIGGVCIIALGMPLAAAAGPWIAAGVVATGLLMGPVTISVFALAETRAPRGRVTEILAYPSAGTSAGVPAGATLAGIVHDGLGSSASFTLMAASAFFGLLVGGGGELLLRLRERRRDKPATATA